MKKNEFMWYVQSIVNSNRANIEHLKHFITSETHKRLDAQVRERDPVLADLLLAKVRAEIAASDAIVAHLHGRLEVT